MQARISKRLRSILNNTYTRAKLTKDLTVTQVGALKPFHGIGSNNTGGVVFKDEKTCEVCGKIMPDSDDMAIRGWLQVVNTPAFEPAYSQYYCPEHKDYV